VNNLPAKLTVASFPFSPGFNPYQRLFTDSLQEAGATVIRLPPEKWFPVQKAFSQPCDILHFDWPHDWYSGRNALTRTLKSKMYLSGLKQKSAGKLVWTAHNLIAHDANNEAHEYRMIQRLIARCDGIMVLSDAAKSELHLHYDVPSSTSVRTIHHGHYIDAYPNTVTRDEARRCLGIGSNEVVYLSLGAIRRYKGHENLIHSFAKTSNANERLIITGVSADFDYVNSLQRLIETQSDQCSGTIDFRPSAVPDNKLQYFFNASDVSILPFDSVLNSGSLLLAMSFGLPVIACGQGSIQEVAHPSHSILFQPSDNPVAAISEAIAASRQAFEGQHERVRQSILDFTRTKYDWCIVGRQLIDWYEQLLGHPPATTSHQDVT